MIQPLASAAVRVIGVGTLDRGDDAAGRLAARRIIANNPQAAFQVKELGGEATELMDAWAHADAVILIDAMAMGLPPGAVKRFDASTRTLPAEVSRSSTHDIGVCQAIELARAMDLLPGQVVVYGIQIAQLSHGNQPSDPVKAAIGQAASAVADEANQLMQGRASHA